MTFIRFFIIPKLMVVNEMRFASKLKIHTGINNIIIDYSYHSYFSSKLPLFGVKDFLSIFTSEITFFVYKLLNGPGSSIKTMMTTYISNKALEYKNKEKNT